MASNSSWVRRPGLQRMASGDADLADVVDEPADADAFGGFLAVPERHRQGGGDKGDAFGMAAGVRVLGVDGGGEGLEGAHEEGMLLGEADGVLVEGAEEVGDGVDELDLGAGDGGFAPLADLAAGDKGADDGAVVGDGSQATSAPMRRARGLSSG